MLASSASRRANQVRCWAPTSFTYASSAKRESSLRGPVPWPGPDRLPPQLIYCKLANRLQHREAQIAIGPLFRLDEARAEKRFQPCQDVGGSLQIGNRLGRFERPTTGEDRQAAKERLLLGGSRS